MKKAGFWKSDWFFGVVVSVVVLFLGNGELLQGLERKAYDMGVAATSRSPSDKIAVIAIDKPSLDNIGRWPWSRDIMADMVDQLAAIRAGMYRSGHGCRCDETGLCALHADVHSSLVEAADSLARAISKAQSEG